MKFRQLLAGIPLLSATAALLSAQTVTWIPSAPDNLFTNPANWIGNSVPPTNASAVLQFPYFGVEGVILPAGPLSFGSLQFEPVTFDNTTYSFSSLGSTNLSIQNGLSKYGTSPTQPVNVTFASNVSITLAANQTWTVNGVSLLGTIAGPGKLTFQPTTTLPDTSYGFGTRRGYLELNGAGNFAGGFEAQQAEIILGNVASFTGTSGPIKLVNSDLRTMVNAHITVPVTFSGEVGFFGTPGINASLILSGALTLEGNVTLLGAAPTTLNGKIAETTPGSKLTVQGKLLLGGDNSTGAYTGGTAVNAASAIVFTTANSVPTTGLITSADSGYVGAGFTTGVQGTLIGRIDAAQFLGTLGFDSPNPASPQTFSEPLDLSGLTNFRGIGSSSSAILSGTITVGPTQNYLFGGGGGRLTVTSNLTNASSQLILNSPLAEDDRPLTVILRGNNTFTGGIQILHGALIFDGPNALPASGAITFNPDEPIGYAGYTEATGLTFSQFTSRLNTTNLTGSETVNILGLDSTNPNAPRTVSETLDLSLGGTITTPYFLGTATKVIVNGTIQPIANQLKLTGVNGGHLIVNSPIPSSVTALTIGAQVQGTVELNAPSTFAGMTTVNSGVLLLGNPGALGTGGLTVGEATIAATTNLSLRNPIVAFSDDGMRLGLPGSPVNLTLQGVTLATQITYQGGGQLKLGGLTSVGNLVVNATGSGGVLVAPTTLFNDFDYYNYNYGYGYGYGAFPSLPFSATLNSGYLAFSTPFATLDTLSGNSGSQLIVHAGTNLALIDFSDGDQSFAGTISGGGSISFFGENAFLSGSNTFSGGSNLMGGGTLFLGSNTALGTGQLQVSQFGGALSALTNGITLSNAISLQSISEDNAYYFGGLGIVGDLQLTLAGVISGPGGIEKLDGGTLRLTGNNTFSGGILIEQGTVEFGHNNAAGNSPVIFDPFTSDVKAVFTTSAPVIRGLANEGGVGATIELAAGSNLTINQNLYSIFTGSITGVGANNAALTKTGFGGLTLFGTNSYSGGTFVTGGGIVFAGTSAIPTTGSFVVSANGYIGFGGLNTSTDINNFLGKFQPSNTLGTIGFDTSNPSNPYLVTTPLSLGGFNLSARLGSASHAIISSTITPAGSPYRFGGGGGLLQVSSVLADQVTPVPITRSVVVDSPATTPLTLRLTSASSSYTGGVNVTQSALVFGPGPTLPSTGALTLGTGGYIGWEDTSLNGNDASMSNYVSRFGTTNGIIGFDTAPGTSTTRVITSAIDLSNSGNAYLGTTSGSDNVAGVRLTGTITPSGSVYRFTGYKGGVLEVASVLSGTRSVVIGDPNVFATLVDPNRSVLDVEDPSYSTVILSALNTHTGNTTLHGGRLLLGGTSALGASTNSLIVQSTAVPAGFAGEGLWRPQLGTTSVGNPAIANGIVLNSSLGLGGPHNFSLTGTISGPGGLFFDGGDDLTVRLGGNNTFTGGLNVMAGLLQIDAANAAGAGPVSLSDFGEIDFNVSSQISALISDDTGYINLANGVTLTVNQTTDTEFHGELSTNGILGGRLVKTGTGTLRLDGYGFGFSGLDTAGTRISVDIQQGTIVAGGDSAPLGNDAVRISGGTLTLANAVLENNLLTVSGRLAGNGLFASSNVSIGASMIISPGFAAGTGPSPIGQLSFDTLTLAGGGVLEWNIQSLTGGGLATDSVGVYTGSGLSVTSTSGNPFTIKVVSLLPDGSSGALSGLLPGETYSWVVFETNGIAGFDPTKFTIDTSQFNSNLGPGFFTLSLSTTPALIYTQSLVLNFSAVPEPSTWALMIGGIAALALTLWRQRKRAQA